MGRFKDWFIEMDIVTREPGEVAGDTPTATADKVKSVANRFVAKNPDFSADVQNAPNDATRADIISQASSQMLKRPNIRNSNITPDVLNNQFAANAGFKPSDIFKMMRKGMKKT